MAIDRFYEKPPQVVDGSVAFGIDVNAINDESYLAFTNVATELDGYIATISYWTQLAESWAEKDEDTQVTVGHYSAYHWAQKAEDLGAAQVSLAAAQVSLAADQVSLAVDQVALANKWAEEAEDTPVTSGHYSALHWAAKSAAFVSQLPPGAINDSIISEVHTWSSRKISSSPFTYFFAQI